MKYKNEEFYKVIIEEFAFTVTKKFLMHALARRKLWFVWVYVCVCARKWSTMNNAESEKPEKNLRKSTLIFFWQANALNNK